MEKFFFNEFILVIVFLICVSIENLEMGLKFKKYIDDNNMFFNLIVVIVLMEMFVKCGLIYEVC